MKRLLTSALALVVAAGPALADPPWARDRDRGEIHRDRHEVGQDRRELRQDYRQDAGPGEIRDDRRELRDDRRELRQDRRDWREDHRPRYRYGDRDHDAWRGPAWTPPRGYVHREWRRGERLPETFWREPRYYVDYRAYHLAPPPRGYRYVRVDNDVFLVAVASGLIAAGIMGMFYSQ